MKTPYLNYEIFCKISGSLTSKGKVAQRKQKKSVKRAIPITQVIVDLREIEGNIKKKLSPELLVKYKLVSPL